MCDVCIKRDRAYGQLSDEDQQAVDLLNEQWRPQLDMLADQEDERAFEDRLIQYGEALDILLRLTPVLVPADLSELTL